MAVELVTLDDFKELFNYFTKSSYQAKKVDAFVTGVQEKCEKLFAKDYRFSIVNNTNGELCNSYPARIIYLEEEKGNRSGNSGKPDEENNNINEAAKFREQVSKSRFARSRTRFPVPVILVDGKYVCRSSTLACGKEIYPRMSFDYFFPDVDTTDADRENINVVDEYDEIDDSVIVDPAEIESDQNDEDSKVGEYRNHDVQLLRDLCITNICDLMMEHKKVKLAIYVTSSEKADKHNRYKDFAILSMPYPGCEFFQKFGEVDYHGERMMFDWQQSYIKRKVELPSDPFASIGVDWTKYKDWDVNTLTQNYMKLIVKCLTEGTSSMLIHCISGWDRTPLFISMLRMSLWADGKVHRSLTALEMIYLTVGYDWFLFGHQLGRRLSNREEIMKYCFYCLKFLIPSEFSSLMNKDQNHCEKGLNSSLESDENPYFTAPSNIISPNNGDVDIMVKNPDTVWSSPEDYAIDPTSSPHRNRPASTSSEKNELSISSVDSSEDLSLVQCSTPPTLVQSKDDGLPFFDPVSDVQPTSPLAVPSSSRQRTESSSSDFSYLIISGTGSVPQSMSPRSSISSPPPELNHCSRLAESPEDSPGVPSESSFVFHLREVKLNELRQIFLTTYFSVVSMRFKSGSGSGIMGFINQYAERVGFRTPKAPS